MTNRSREHAQQPAPAAVTGRLYIRHKKLKFADASRSPGGSSSREGRGEDNNDINREVQTSDCGSYGGTELKVELTPEAEKQIGELAKKDDVAATVAEDVEVSEDAEA